MRRTFLILCLTIAWAGLATMPASIVADETSSTSSPADETHPVDHSFLGYVPHDSFFFAMVRPRQLLKYPASTSEKLQAIRDGYLEGVSADLRVNPEHVEQLAVICFGENTMFLGQLVKSVTAEQIMESLDTELTKVKHNGSTYFKRPSSEECLCFYADGRVIMTDEQPLREILSSERLGKGPFVERLLAVQPDNDAIVFWDTTAMPPKFRERMLSKTPDEEFRNLFAVLPHTKTALLTAKLSDDVPLRLQVETTGPEWAALLYAGAEQAFSKLRQTYNPDIRAGLLSVPDFPEIRILTGVIDKIFDGTTLKPNGTTMEATINAPGGLTEALDGMLLGVILIGQASQETQETFETVTEQLEEPAGK